MTQNIFHLSASEMLMTLGTGALCALIYLGLLWQTLHLLPRVGHKGLFLFSSATLRIFLLLAVMVLFSNHEAGRFILIFCGFAVVRLLILSLSQFGEHYSTQGKQFHQSHGKRAK